MPRKTVNAVKRINVWAEKDKDFLSTGDAFGTSDRGYDLPTGTLGDAIRTSMDNIPSGHFAITRNGSVMTLLPLSLRDAIEAVISWLSVASILYHSVRLREDTLLQKTVSDSSAILYHAFIESVHGANQLWLLGIMEEGWYPWQLATVLTFWDLLGFLHPTAWTKAFPYGTDKWVTVSCILGNIALLSIAYNLRVQTGTEGMLHRLFSHRGKPDSSLDTEIVLGHYMLQTRFFEPWSRIAGDASRDYAGEVHFLGETLATHRLNYLRTPDSTLR